MVYFSAVDPEKHLVCEPCDPKLVGGFDHDAKEVNKLQLYNMFLLHRHSEIPQGGTSI